MLVSHRGQQSAQTKEEQEYDDDNEGTITTTSCRGQEVSYRRRHGHDDRWFCDEHDEQDQDQDHESEREVAFADELPRRARGDLHRATGGSGLDSKIGDLDRRMSRLAAPPSPTAGSAKPPTQPQPQLCSTGEGDESGEERRRSPVSSFTAVVDITTSTSSSSAARLPLVATEKEEHDDDDGERVHNAAQEQDQSEQDVDEDEEEEEEEEEEENEEDDEEAELVEVDEDEAERAEEVAEELAPFDAATEHLLHLLDELRDDNGQYRYRRGQVVAVAGGVRTLKQRVEDFAEPLAGFCPAQASQLRLAVRSLSNAVVQLLNGLQAGTQAYIESKMAEVRGLVVTLRPLLVQFLLEACAEAEANQDLIRQAAYLKEAAHVGTETVKLLKRAWEEMLDTSVLAANIKHMIRLCVLAADKANGMRETMAKRLKRRCLRLGKTCESLMRGVRQGVEVDDQFEKLVLALSEWLAALNKAHQDIRLVR